MAALASVEQLGAYLGRSFPAGAEEDQAALMLDLASGAVRAHTRQTLSRVTTTTQLRIGSGGLDLPERPVVEVVGISAGGVAVAPAAYAVVGSTIVWGAWPVNTSLGHPLAPDSVVDVEYTHGFDPVPDDIVGVVLAAAARAIETLTGVKSESIGSYSVTYAGADGGIVLLELERATLNRYRRRTW